MAKYWNRRKRMLYYRYLEAIVRGVAAECHSMIDVGSYNTPIIEKFHWIADRATIDLKKPYSSETVRGIQADFMTFQPEKRFDFALCSQVLEHIEDAGPFAQHLFDIADRVLISVPYNWPAGVTVSHIHDPVDEHKLLSWTKREPDYHVVAEEPLSLNPNRFRLIAYYAKPGEKGWLKNAQLMMREGGPKKPAA